MCKHLPIFGKVYTGYYSLLSRKNNGLFRLASGLFSCCILFLFCLYLCKSLNREGGNPCFIALWTVFSSLWSFQVGVAIPLYSVLTHHSSCGISCKDNNLSFMSRLFRRMQQITALVQDCRSTRWNNKFQISPS